MARCLAEQIRDNPLRYYFIDSASPANPARAAVDNNLFDLLGMMSRLRPCK